MLPTFLKHKIYESCIDIFFDGLMKNFQVSNSTPEIGDRYSRIYDKIVGDTFYDCMIVPIKHLSFYDDLVEAYEEDGLSLEDIAFGIRYSKYVDDLGEVESFDSDSYGETTFVNAELEDIIFEK
jgi:hypothetical protein